MILRLSHDVHYLLSKDSAAIQPSSLESLQDIFSRLAPTLDLLNSSLSVGQESEGETRRVVPDLGLGAAQRGVGQERTAVCIPATTLAINVLHEMLLRIEESLEQHTEGGTTPAVIQKLAVEVQQAGAITDYLLPGAIKADPQEPFYQGLTEPVWNNLQRFVSESVHESNYSLGNPGQDT